MIPMSDNNSVETKVVNLEETQPVVDETKTVGQNQKPPIKGIGETGIKAPSQKKLAVEKLDLSDDDSKKPLKEKNMNQKQKITVAVMGIVAIILGVSTGYGAFKLQARSGATDKDSPVATQQVAGDVINVGDVFGIKDDKTFPDRAQGYLEKGGLEGEGSHRLLREGGESQTVYLTSSITDLDKFVGMEVIVWGETFKGQKAGWLMDVGRVQIETLEAEAPFTE